MLTNSDNNTAELLTKELGHHATGKAGTTADGVAATLAYLTSKGYPTAGVHLVDGSGLDVSDRVTCTLLDDVLEGDGPNGVIAQGLPVAGKTGTLKDRYGKSTADGQIRAKTGTLNSVTALSGWAHTTQGKDLTFSFLLNLTGRKVAASDLTLEERLTEQMLTYPDAPPADQLAPLAARSAR